MHQKLGEKKAQKKKNSKLHSEQAHTEIDKHFSTSLCAFQLCAIFLFSPFKMHQHAQGKDNVTILFQFFSSVLRHWSEALPP